MFGHKKRLYREGVQAEGQVYGITSYGTSSSSGWDFGVKVRVKLPDGSTREIEEGRLGYKGVGRLFVGSVVPVRYDAANPRKVVLDVPALRELNTRTEAGLQARLDAQFEHLGEPAAPSPGSVIDLRSADPVDRLAKLGALEEHGLLSDAELAAVKAKLLARG